MPERARYSHLFKENPFEGVDPTEMFSILHWGRQHGRTFEIDAPEPLIMLGTVKLLGLATKELVFRRGEAFLAVGRNSNEMYVVPRRNNAPLPLVPTFNRSVMKRVGFVLQTDYWATKGTDKDVHYYHKHEEPFPTLWVHRSGVGYIRAASHEGKPSYAVGREGIVG